MTVDIDFDATDPDEKPPITFKLKGLTYEAVPEAPGGVLLTLASLPMGKDPEAVLKRTMAVAEFLDRVLLHSSAEQFAENFNKPGPHTISLEKALEVMTRLVQEKYGGGRPTEQQSPSPDGRSTTGTSSTATAATDESTLEPSPSAASST